MRRIHLIFAFLTLQLALERAHDVLLLFVLLIAEGHAGELAADGFRELQNVLDLFATSAVCLVLTEDSD